MPTLRPRIIVSHPKPIAPSGTRYSSRIRTQTDRLSPVVFSRVSYN